VAVIVVPRDGLFGSYITPMAAAVVEVGFARCPSRKQSSEIGVSDMGSCGEVSRGKRSLASEKPAR
jgi:hypothetical protein